jgi:5-methylcytosine-specific restriction protein A
MKYVCSRAGCGRITEQRKCEQHRKRDEAPRANEDIRRRYRTDRWARLRNAILERDNGLCRECLSKGIVKTGNQIDHVKKAMDNLNLFWDPQNLQTLCDRCHSQKTARGE